MLIDAQMHAYSTPPRAGLPDVTSAGLITAMDRVGIDSSILVSPWIPYRDDPAYAIDAYEAYPSRFRVVAVFDARAPDLEVKWERFVATPGAVGVRLLSRVPHHVDATESGVRLIANRSARAGHPVCVLCWDRLDLAAELAQIYPDTLFVLDHLGLTQPLRSPPPHEPFAELPALLELARFDNVTVKVTGACTMSRLAYPFDDLWEPIGRIVDAYGVHRCMWGTDWTRTHELVGIDDAVAAFRDQWPGSPEERAALMGATAAAVFGWHPDA